MRKELKLFYKVISLETLFWVLLIVGSVYYFWNIGNYESILLPLSDFQRGYFSSENTKVYLKFQVDITANYLWGVHRFSSYRKHLKDLIKKKSIKVMDIISSVDK